MKSLKIMALLGGLFIGALSASAADTNAVLKPFPFDHCMISGDKIGEMGKPYVTNYYGQEIKFCCPDCVKDFNKDPQAYMKKINAAEAKKK